MGDTPSLHMALKGLNLQVDVEHLSDTAEYIGVIADHWDDAVLGYLRHHIAPVSNRIEASGTPRVAGCTNPHGRFGEATNLKGDIADAEEKLARRAQKIAHLLHELRTVTAQLGRNYETTELSNQADQKALIALLDAGMSDAQNPGGTA